MDLEGCDCGFRGGYRDNLIPQIIWRISILFISLDIVI